MRQLLSITFVVSLAVASSSGAQSSYGSSAPYALERWEEDFSYLKSPEARGEDLFDPLKFVPLNAGGDWYLSFGGQFRERYDYFNNLNFGAGAQDEDGFRLTRMLAHVDAHFGPNLRAFVQLDSSLANDRVGGYRPGDADDFDIQQAFADVKLSLNGAASATVRVGRQELVYGAQRLVSPNDWANVRRSFDGAKVSFSFPNDALDVFWTRPVVIDKSHFNGDDDHTWFAGIYNVTALPGFLPGARSKLDLYLLALEHARSTEYAAASGTYTLGSRLHTTPGPWDFDVEADWQFGYTDSSAIGAWAVAGEAGYTFRQTPLTPRAALGLDLASGSANPAHRFNQLFPPQYLYLGHMYRLGRQNLIDLHGGIDLDLTRDVTFSVAQHFFWRQNTHDAIYDLSGAVVRASGGSGKSAIGNEFDAVINWQLQQHLSAYVGYAHFFAGPFIQDTGPAEDTDFAYVAVTFTF